MAVGPNRRGRNKPSLAWLQGYVHGFVNVLPLILLAHSSARRSPRLPLLATCRGAEARLAVVSTGKPRVAVVDLSRKKVVARPSVGLRLHVALAQRRRLYGYVVGESGTGAAFGDLDLSSAE